MDVVQRIGPRVVGWRQESLTRTAPATRAQASVLRRDFRVWVDPLADPDTADDLALAVYEALANVVDHAYTDHADTDRFPGPGDMRLWAGVSPPLPGGRDLVITVSDDGAWRRAGECGWRGRGLSLMRSFTHTAVLLGLTGTTVQLRLRVSPGASLAVSA